ncbi:MAG: ABC-2 transporter permease [bacterium]
MPPTLVIAKREFKAYFTGPIAYVYLTAFLGLSSWFFFRTFFLSGQTTLRAFFGLTPWLFLFFIPAVTMGKWSEERRLGTDEILFTLPLHDRSIILGKFLSGLFFVVLSLLLTLPLVFTVSQLGKLDLGPVWGGYVALFLLAASFLSMGLFASTLSKNQIVAFLLGVVLCFLFFVLGESLILSHAPASLAPLLSYLSVQTHFESMGRGVLDTRDWVYYLSFISFFLYLNRISLMRRR